MEPLSECLEPSNANILGTPINVETLSDAELLALVAEFQQSYFDDNSILRTLSKQYFGNDNLVNIVGVALKILPIVAERMRCYSPHV